ncbi:hypothetical protein KPL70_005265 [Citrus sinensis]|uniref:Uncharacterized protein n=2 Tax=Citrus sinensis TaxID=2711 RepID=A0ACB8NH11_CITSI|nr:uncharacterized protein LOC102628675 [Citrus sinensis]KAH9749101.1 hypothetical protein KPL70_005265 [Citrus sinensis]KAH9797399.1 hypothetical protein KPL71_005860 [Citrus sinensis]KDO77904.1 hypothetical protein CISIN_1g026058mg [Citrus sinensis]
MDSERILKLFDTCWFEMEILKKQSRSSICSKIEASRDNQNEEKPSKAEFLRVPTSHKRSMSAQLSSETSFNNSFSFSPDSVLSPPKLQTILSGKEVTVTEEVGETKQAQAHYHVQEFVSKKKGVHVASTRRRKKNSESKSLSDLEFEELKGFMDLGFVFTEEDNKDSRLVEIVPGLQRLGKKDDTVDNSPVSRPYLSEAWEIMDTTRKENSLLINWKISALNNEMDIKDNLRWWAHTVALSAVR